MSLYSDKDRIHVAVDSIIFGFDEDRELKLLLINRNFEPRKGAWSLMGGFVNEDEDVDETAKRVLHSLTGLKNEDVFLEQLQVYGKVGRDEDTRRVVSVAYYALIDTNKYDQKLLKEHNAKWFPLDRVPKLIFDHQDMVNTALERLKFKINQQPIGFNLLPEKFTMAQLRMLYESILGHELDKRNFVKRIQKLDIIEKLEEKEIGYSKRGAYYYQFIPEKYEALCQSGNSYLFLH